MYWENIGSEVSGTLTTTLVLPAGHYLYIYITASGGNNDNDIRLEANTSLGWVKMRTIMDTGVAAGINGVYSDGTNIRLDKYAGNDTITYRYKKLA